MEEVLKYQTFYVIRPNKVLLARVLQVQNEEVLPESFTKPCLWSKYSWDDRSLQSKLELQKDENRELKILFILKLKILYRDELSQVFGHDVPQDDSDFDKWWDLDFFDGCDEYFEEMFRELESSMKAGGWRRQEKELMSRLTLVSAGEIDE